MGNIEEEALKALVTYGPVAGKATAQALGTAGGTAILSLVKKIKQKFSQNGEVAQNVLHEAETEPDNQENKELFMLLLQKFSRDDSEFRQELVDLLETAKQDDSIKQVLHVTGNAKGIFTNINQAQSVNLIYSPPPESLDLKHQIERETPFVNARADKSEIRKRFYDTALSTINKRLRHWSQ